MTTLVVPNLEPYTQYSFRVRAVAALGLRGVDGRRRNHGNDGNDGSEAIHVLGLVGGPRARAHCALGDGTACRHQRGTPPRTLGDAVMTTGRSAANTADPDYGWVEWAAAALHGGGGQAVLLYVR